MKAVGLAVCAVAIPVSAVKAVQSPVLANLDGVDIRQIPGLTEPCEGSFVPTYDPLSSEREYITATLQCDHKRFFEIQDCMHTVNEDDIYVQYKGSLYFYPAGRLLMVDISGYKHGNDGIIETKVFCKVPVGRAWNDIFAPYDVYRKTNFAGVFAKCSSFQAHAKIKEKR
jgi:hypothetical protein